MATLRERITAPTHLDVPEPTGGLTFRAASRDDVVGMHAVAVAAAAEDDPLARPSTGALERALSTEGMDVPRDTVVGVDPDGHVQAFGIVIDVPSRVTAARAVLEGAVHPAHRGRRVGRRVLDWQVGRARQRLALLDVDLPASLDVGGPLGASGLRLAARAGFAPARTWVAMQLVFGEQHDGPSSQALPDGLVVRASTADDIEPLRTAKNDAFRDHWGSQPMVASDWHGFLTAAVSRPDLSRVVVDADGRVLAFAIVEVDPDAFAARGRSFGYVHWVGVVRSARGRGLAPLVLDAAIRAMRADGLAAAVLDVDAENPSGAVRLYEGLGFVAGDAHVTASIAT
ncbi:GNAT family N-acetyltransferase [Curtobacterium oceanosedimentum]|uniref:GNAT family N-acetyltransferase n=1 Tax=Curtobacterium oceanosedimentum TaxID=465820 RepID=UPI001CE11C6F|nr:GNAT family N-acetyltransferase [Curtobacterium oceanosedimentum]MCA5923292.1 GNAT family N-acetyltransferase [Curtobacterium oceanosedimentum]